jgi:hypothetical protein
MGRLPLMICMPQTSRYVWDAHFASVDDMATIFGRLAERGVKVLPEWEEGAYHLRKSAVTLDLQAKFPAPTAAGGLVDLCVLPTVALPSVQDGDVTACLTQVGVCFVVGVALLGRLVTLSTGGAGIGAG